MSGRKEQALEVNDLKLALVNRDYQEAITYSFVDPKVQSQLYPEIDAIVLPH